MEIERRLRLPENREKYVDLHLKRLPGKMTVLVSDQRPGFDFKKYLLDEITTAAVLQWQRLSSVSNASAPGIQ